MRTFLMFATGLFVNFAITEGWLFLWGSAVVTFCWFLELLVTQRNSAGKEQT